MDKLDGVVDYDVSAAYSRRSTEYIQLFGSMSEVHPADRQLVSLWAGELEGEVIDAGCGPGHWTNFLAEHGLSARGIDLVPEFIERARGSYPQVLFVEGSVNNLDIEAGTVGGVLSWYSLIHHEPDTIRVPLREFHRVLRDGGSLLIGFFEGPSVEEFPHAVVPAYRWSVDALTNELAATGFDVMESRVRRTVGQRPQAAIVAQRCRHHT